MTIEQTENLNQKVSRRGSTGALKRKNEDTEQTSNKNSIFDLQNQMINVEPQRKKQKNSKKTAEREEATKIPIPIKQK
ncbi:unnamed protein product [Brachionus calyciflorus]|uniref:Uncharacterized protein n=1 Tax=Brachionus calyciflorus TaxID=104777 RepID=A0A814CXS9_9BILA|nr:unnamed protein product [Brachionus calyciflorus]